MTKVLIIITPGIYYTILRVFVQSILKLRTYLIFWFESFHLSSLLLTRKNTSNVDYFTFDNTNIKEITGLFFKNYNHSSCGCCSFRKKTSKPSSNNIILRINKRTIYFINKTLPGPTDSRKSVSHKRESNAVQTLLEQITSTIRKDPKNF